MGRGNATIIVDDVPRRTNQCHFGIITGIYQIFNGVILVLENLFRGRHFNGAFKKKNTRGAVPGLAVHLSNKTDHHTNKEEIDVFNPV